MSNYTVVNYHGVRKRKTSDLWASKGKTDMVKISEPPKLSKKDLMKPIILPFNRYPAQLFMGSRRYANIENYLKANPHIARAAVKLGYHPAQVGLVKPMPAQVSLVKPMIRHHQQVPVNRPKIIVKKEVVKEPNNKLNYDVEDDYTGLQFDSMRLKAGLL